MIDVSTQKPLQVRNEGTVGPYVCVPLDQLDRVRQHLDQHGIHYRVSENALSLNGGPYLVDVNFARNADPEAIQAVLDAAA